MNKETNVTVNREYKSTVFAQLFKDKKKLLSLYNALNNSNYTDDNDLEIVTLENAIYMSMKNDLAFLLDCKLHLYEHQSTPNPNMPLRDLFYVSKKYMQYVNRVRKYMYEYEMKLEDAVERAVTECIKENILKDFLIENRAEVIAMSIFEFDEEREMKLIREEEYKSGLEDGAKLERIKRIQIMIKKGKSKVEILNLDYAEEEYAEAKSKLM